MSALLYKTVDNRVDIHDDNLGIWEKGCGMRIVARQEDDTH
jgi:hypothetical protein